MNCPYCNKEMHMGYLQGSGSMMWSPRKKHLFISAWLESLGVEKSIAAEDACKIEHVISNESFLAIKKHVQDTQNS